MQDASDLELHLVLGCYGREDDGFTTCSSVINPILHIHDELEDYDHIIAYLRSVNLFKRKLNNYNGIRNVLFFIQNTFYQKCKTMWTAKHFRLIENFTIQHQQCGIYLSLELLKPKSKHLKSDKEIIIEPVEL